MPRPSRIREPALALDSPGHDFEGIASHDKPLGTIGKLALEAVRSLAVIDTSNFCSLPSLQGHMTLPGSRPALTDPGEVGECSIPRTSVGFTILRMLSRSPHPTERTAMIQTPVASVQLSRNHLLISSHTFSRIHSSQ